MWLRSGGLAAAYRRSFCPDSCKKAHVVCLASCSRVRARSAVPYLRIKYCRLGEFSTCSAVRYHGPARSDGKPPEAPPLDIFFCAAWLGLEEPGGRSAREATHPD